MYRLVEYSSKLPKVIAISPIFWSVQSLSLSLPVPFLLLGRYWQKSQIHFPMTTPGHLYALFLARRGGGGDDGEGIEALICSEYLHVHVREIVEEEGLE